MKKKRKKQDKHSFALLAFALSFLIYAMVWTEVNGPLVRPSLTKRAEGEIHVSSTTLSDEFYRNEWIRMFDLEGKTYRKSVIDNDKKKILPDTYAVQSDAFSVSKVSLLPAESGLVVRILTPTHFTHVTLDGVMNALATAGAEDAQIDLLSPIATTGENALVGVFPHFLKDETDIARMNLAQTEMGWYAHLNTYYYTNIKSPRRISQALAKTKLSVRETLQIGRKKAIRKSLRTHWAEYELPRLNDADEADLVQWLYQYQESTASKDKETRRILETIIEE